MAVYRVVEKFVSINGEAMKAGELSCFIRFAGCNLACSYCDTAWANKADVPCEELNENEIYDYIKKMNVSNVTLTGGEPLLQADIMLLIDRLLEDESIRVEIETNGAVDISDFRRDNERLSFTVDYKLPGSGMEAFMHMENYNMVTKSDTVKFVAASFEDLEKAREIIERYSLVHTTNVYISTVFDRLQPSSVVDFMINNNMNGVRLQLQMHKYIWEPDRKGV